MSKKKLTTMKNKLILVSTLTTLILSTAFASVPEIWFPFHIRIDPMERLLLINIENDTDSIYAGFEPQVFDNHANGAGMLVIAWRNDGYVDVYHQPGLNLEHDRYDIAGKGLATMVMRPMEGAFFVISENGVRASIRFHDIYDRLIELEISENNTRKRKPFGLLAPMGVAAEAPSSMPMILLHDFYFVRRKNTDLSVRIGGRLHQPDVLPMPIDRQKMYFTRYCPDPLIATLNPAQKDSFLPVNQTVSSGHENTDFCLVEKDGRKAVASMHIEHKDYTLTMRFDPPVPDMANILPGEQISGRFTIEGHKSTGKISGIYHFRESDGVIHSELNPSKGWKPRPDKLSLRFLYTVAGVFKNWPKSYWWTAEINMHAEGEPHMVSGWERR
jgi:hypothetical protein